jgi:hypothetical protein
MNEPGTITAIIMTTLAIPMASALTPIVAT